MRLPVLETINSQTALDPDGVFIILDNLEKILGLVELHVLGREYKHEARHINFKNTDVYTEVMRLRGLIGQLRGQTSTLSANVVELDKKCEHISTLIDKLTNTSINGCVGDVVIRPMLASDMMVGNALDKSEITIVNTEVEVKI